jgi:hypothetical protein
LHIGFILATMNPNHIFKAGCLFQEYIVDLWAAAKQSHLTWLRNNQKTLCSDVYKGLVDAVAAIPDAEAQKLGQCKGNLTNLRRIST